MEYLNDAADYISEIGDWISRAFVVFNNITEFQIIVFLIFIVFIAYIYFLDRLQIINKFIKKRFMDIRKARELEEASEREMEEEKMRDKEREEKMAQENQKRLGGKGKSVERAE